MPDTSTIRMQQRADLLTKLMTPDPQAVEMVTVLLDRQIVERFKADGPNWKQRMQAVLGAAQL